MELRNAIFVETDVCRVQVEGRRTQEDNRSMGACVAKNKEMGCGQVVDGKTKSHELQRVCH
jgi:hypothetical protein